MRRTNNSLGASGAGNKTMAIVAIVATLGCLWITAFLLLGGEEQSSSPNDSAPAPETTAAEPAPAEPTTDRPESDPTGGEDFAASSTDEPEAVDVDRNAQQQATPGQKPNVKLPDESVDYDPLGTGADSESLTETEKGRVELAAEQFVIHAYGFTGNGKDGQFEYETGVSQHVDAATFYDSPGTQPLAELAKKIKSGGITSTASMDSFSIQTAKPGRVDGTATFTVESPDGSVTYAQDLTLTKTGNLWRVGAAQEIEEATR